MTAENEFGGVVDIDNNNMREVFTFSYFTEETELLHKIFVFEFPKWIILLPQEELDTDKQISHSPDR